MTTNSKTIAVLVSRIERAPNVSRLVAAYDAAIKGSVLSIHRMRGTEWQVWHGEVSSFVGSFSQVRSHLAARAEEILDHAAAAQVASAPAIVPTPAQPQQACAAAADRWMRISSRIYGDTLIGAIRAEQAEVVVSGDWYRDSALPVVRIEGDRYIMLGFAENEDAAAACGRCWGYRFDVAILTRDAHRPIAYVLLGDGEPDRGDRVPAPAPATAAVERDDFSFTVPSVAEPTPTFRWLDEEVHAWVKQILVDLEEPEPPRPLSPELAAVVVATREWLSLYDEWSRAPTNAGFGAMFDARVRLQDAHARLSAEAA